MAIERSADAGTQAAAPWPAVTAALAVGSVALLIPGLQPILLGELVACHAVKQRDFTGVRQARDFEQVTNLGFPRAVEYRRGHGNTLAEALGIFE